MMRTKIEQALKLIQMKKMIQPEIGIVLGSGLGVLAEEVENKVVIPFMEIPYFVSSTVEGHEGVLVLGTLAGKDVVIMRGRLHYYEGYSIEEITFPIQVMKAIGITKLILTNASGAINNGYQPGDLILIKDHINFMGINPLRAEKGESINFLNLTGVYSPELRRLAKTEAAKLQVQLQEGIYAAVTGPTYETPAEIKMFKKIGADIIGMSTVPEAIIARSLGLEILGLACVTNRAAGIGKIKHSHRTTLEIAQKVSFNLNKLIKALLRKI
ncbi:MAG: purine-nucleoside phosphorylase [bacterium]|nr:purine-nucleoside phosphorylase [bacterium]MDD5354659.1 purine-nucleoside phosphorylase [bacterium]MDD5756038.1 purine-nucleoside phosphorylase [bacterium]